MFSLTTESYSNNIVLQQCKLCFCAHCHAREVRSSPAWSLFQPSPEYCCLAPFCKFSTPVKPNHTNTNNETLFEAVSSVLSVGKHLLSVFSTRAAINIINHLVYKNDCYNFPNRMLSQCNSPKIRKSLKKLEPVL